MKSVLLLGFMVATLALDSAQAQPRNIEVRDSAGERRVALVIGNSAYRSAPLANPVNDATDMAQALESAGFKVILRRDVGTRDMRRAIREFGSELRRADVGLFYFAGHGVQVRGNNYLVPVDAEIESEADAEDLGVDANYALRTMDEAQVKVSIVILDACRNNPFARGFRSVTRGLAQMSAAVGSVIAFATAPGTVAADGAGRNGLYTRHLLENMRHADSELLKVFQRTRAAVVSETGGRQVPWESTSLIGDFYFQPPSAAAVAPPAVLKPAATAPERIAGAAPLTRRCAIKPLWFTDGTSACLEQFEIFHLKNNGVAPVEQFRGRKSLAYAVGAGRHCTPSHAWSWDDAAGKDDLRAVNLCERYAKKAVAPEACSCTLIAPASGKVPMAQKDFVQLMFRNYYDILAQKRVDTPQFAREIDVTRLQLEAIEQSHYHRIDGDADLRR